MKLINTVPIEDKSSEAITQLRIGKAPVAWLPNSDGNWYFHHGTNLMEHKTAHNYSSESITQLRNGKAQVA